MNCIETCAGSGKGGGPPAALLAAEINIWLTPPAVEIAASWPGEVAGGAGPLVDMMTSRKEGGAPKSEAARLKSPQR